MSPCIGFARGLRAHPAALPHFSYASYAWLETPLAACLARVADVPNWSDPIIWPAGRLFGGVGEYRWQWLSNDTLHAVLLLESGPLPAPFSSPLELRLAREAALVLWGKWVDQRDPQGSPDTGPRFYANEIPHIQTYPIDLQRQPQDNETPRLVVRYYRDNKGNQGEFVRCADFVMQATEKER